MIKPPSNSSLKRPIPSSAALAWRAGYLMALRWLHPRPPKNFAPIGLEPGNTKVGRSGSIYRTGFVWNLPAHASCPGASAWCRTCCYNADPRTNIFPVDDWLENWAWLEYEPTALGNRISQQLDEASPPIAVRVHSSGDFFSPDYISFWISIAKRQPNVHFWAYTRSWVVEELLPKLGQLRVLPNFELFASIDDTMPTPPKDWRLAIVSNNTKNIRRSPADLPCPEQVGKIASCVSCGYCIESRLGNVIFSLH